MWSLPDSNNMTFYLLPFLEVKNIDTRAGLTERQEYYSYLLPVFNKIDLLSCLFNTSIVIQINKEI